MSYTNTTQVHGNTVVVASIDEMMNSISTMFDEKMKEVDSRSIPDPYLNVEEAASYLSCTPRRIHDLSYERKLQFKRDGKRLLTRVSWIEEYLDGGGAA